VERVVVFLDRTGPQNPGGDERGYRARVNGADLNQLITDFEELESVECGTHPDLVVNNAGTVDNTLELTERVTRQINDSITELLACAEPFARVEEKVSA